MHIGLGLNLGRVDVRSVVASTPAWEAILNLAADDGWLAVFDPTNPNTRSLSGSEVTAIADGRGNLPDLVPLDANNTTHSAAAFGELDGMTFDGTQGLETETEPSSLAQPNTVIALFKCTGDKTSGDNHVVVDARSGSARNYLAARGSIGNKGFAAWASSFLDTDHYDNLPHVMMGTYNGSNGELWMDGHLILEGDIGTNALLPIRVGKHVNGGDPFVGDIGLILVYDGVPSAAVRDRMLDLIVARANTQPTMTIELLDQSDVLVASGQAQGVAYDGTHHYTTDSTTLRKWSRDGNGDYTLVDSATGLVPSGATQLNSIDIHNGSLWIGANNHSNTPPECWLIEVDPSDLSLLNEYSLSDAHWGEGGVWKDVGDGDEFWVVFHDWDRVSRYKLDNGSMVKQGDHVLPIAEGETTNLYQGAVWWGNLFIGQRHRDSAYTSSDIYEWTGSGFTGLQRLPAPTDGSGQGIFWETEGSVLLFADRAVPNSEQRITRVQPTLLS